MTLAIAILCVLVVAQSAIIYRLAADKVASEDRWMLMMKAKDDAMLGLTETALRAEGKTVLPLRRREVEPAGPGWLDAAPQKRKLNIKVGE